MTTEHHNRESAVLSPLKMKCGVFSLPIDSTAAAIATQGAAQCE